jgi:hypothetical protein
MGTIEEEMIGPHHQICNLKHNAKKKDRLGAIGNVADEVILLTR